jgi:renalase
MTPAWSLMAAFATPLPGPDLLPGARGITGAHRVSSKPGRAAHPDRWVVEASPEWTAPRLEDAREAIAPQLLDLFAGLAGLDQEPIHHVAHRWRYARTSIPIGRPKLQDGPVIAAGDWLLGPDAGNAYASGLAAAGAVLDRL